MNDSEVEKDSGEFTIVSPLKKMMRALTILFQLASINDFYYFLGRRVCCAQAIQIFAALSLSIQFSSQERSHLQDSNQTTCEKSDPALLCRKA